MDDTQKVIKIMGVTLIERADLVTYRLKEVAHTWYQQWKKDRGNDAGSVGWDTFITAFLDQFFLLELKEYKVYEFINLRQVNIT